jgi:hypothetical protein
MLLAMRFKGPGGAPSRKAPAPHLREVKDKCRWPQDVKDIWNAVAPVAGGEHVITEVLWKGKRKPAIDP